MDTFSCNLCEKHFADLGKLKQHTMECLKNQEFGLMNNLIKQNTDKKEEDCMDEPVDIKKEEINAVKNILVMKNYQANQSSVEEDVLAIETEYNGEYIIEDFQRRTEILSCILCEDLFSTLSQMRKHTRKCLEKVNGSIKGTSEGSGDEEQLLSKKVEEFSVVQDSFSVPSMDVNEDVHYNDGDTRLIEPETFKDVEQVTDNPNACDTCFKIFNNRRYLRKHIKYVHTTKPLYPNSEAAIKLMDFQCPFCDKLYHKKYSLQGHLRTIHTKEESKCDLCAKIFGNRRYLNFHIRNIHTNSEESHCDQCEKVFENKRNLKEHILRFHNIENVSCEKCGKDYRNKTMLAEHNRSSTCSRGIDKRRRLQKKENGGVCNQCQKTVSHLKKHKRYAHNTSGTLFPCPNCNKEFVSSAQRGLHINQVHVVNHVTCETCGKVYKNEIILQKHKVRAHKQYINESVKYFCDQCEYRGTQQGGLKRHQQSKH